MADRKSFTEEIKQVAEMKGSKEERIAARNELLGEVLNNVTNFVYPCNELEMPILAAAMLVTVQEMQGSMEIKDLQLMKETRRVMMDNFEMQPLVIYNEWEKVCD
ncbi:hypothetical protein [Anaerostipes butyraticus]|uniref:Uncharacterized protein n=1 Tax=Anaerostipes butyraticus TaxID=645466 RepID=A0A916Q8Y3_9FIRM|nr:hypothetical protein [Anaerostipes butyraticus]GFO86533.1 hypothetical protein ANBU17_28800 [Anaerostipes butyraticus]